MGNDYTNYITVGDMKKALSEYPDTMKIFFFDKNKDDNFSFSSNITFDYFPEIGIPDENGNEIKEEVLAFTRLI